MEDLEFRLRKAEAWYQKKCYNAEDYYENTLMFLKNFKDLHKEVMHSENATNEQKARTEYLYECCMIAICSEFGDIANAECYHEAAKNSLYIAGKIQNPITGKFIYEEKLNA